MASVGTFYQNSNLVKFIRKYIQIGCSDFVAFSPSTFGGEKAPLVQVCKYITAGGFAALGINAKDFNVTGNNKE